MRAKKQVIFISALVATIGLVVFTMAIFCGDCFLNTKTLEWIKAVFAGVFTSALVTLLVSIGEYHIAKKRALEDFYRAEQSLLFQFKRLKVLTTKLPINLLQECIREEIIANLGASSSVNAHQEAKLLLWEQLTPEFQRVIEADGSKDQFLENDLKRTIENDKAALEEVIQQYLQFEKEASIKELFLAYTDIDFIFDNEKILGSLLYDKILKGLQKAMETVLDLTYHLRIYTDATDKCDSGNILGILSMIVEVQEYLFEVKEEKEYTAVYNRLWYEMDSYSYELLKYIYGNRFKESMPDKRRYIVCGTYHNVKAGEDRQEE